MKRMMPGTALVLAGILISGATGAVEPAYVGPFGNPEEPALRPYKAICPFILSLFVQRGEEPSRSPRPVASAEKALMYQTWKSFVDGNIDKMPVLGSVEAGRGFGRGLVEYYSRLAMALSGSLPRPYKELGKANQIIEDDPILRNVRDILGNARLAGILADGTGAIPTLNVAAAKELRIDEYYLKVYLKALGPHAGAAKLVPGVSIRGVQQFVDQEPLAKFHETTVKAHDKLWPDKSRVREAQKRYVPKRVNANAKGGRRNLLKLARYGD